MRGKTSCFATPELLDSMEKEEINQVPTKKKTSTARQKNN